jgi:hypothetical protein
MTGRRALLCVLIGHEAPHARDDPARCRRPGCDARWPSASIPPKSGIEFPPRAIAHRTRYDEVT